MADKIAFFRTHFLPRLPQPFVVVAAMDGADAGDLRAEAHVLFTNPATYTIDLESIPVEFLGRSLRDAPEKLDLDFMLDQAKTLAWSAIYDRQLKVAEKEQNPNVIVDATLHPAKDKDLLHLWMLGYTDKVFHQIRDNTRSQSLENLLSKYLRYPRMKR